MNNQAKLYYFKDKIEEIAKDQAQSDFHAAVRRIAEDFAGADSYTISDHNIELLNSLEQVVAYISHEQLSLYKSLQDKAYVQKHTRKEFLK